MSSCAIGYMRDSGIVESICVMIGGEPDDIGDFLHYNVDKTNIDGLMLEGNKESFDDDASLDESVLHKSLNAFVRYYSVDYLYVLHQDGTWKVASSEYSKFNNLGNLMDKINNENTNVHQLDITQLKQEIFDELMETLPHAILETIDVIMDENCNYNETVTLH